jgi:hypothetical protein
MLQRPMLDNDTELSLLALKDYAEGFCERHDIEKTDELSIMVDQFALDRESYEQQEQFDKKYLLLSKKHNMTLLMTLEAAFANFLMQMRYGGHAGDGMLWNVSQAESFTYFCNQLAEDIVSVLRQKGLDVSCFEQGKWQSSFHELLEPSVSLLSVQSMVVSLGSHKVALELITAAKPDGISFEEPVAEQADCGRDALALVSFLDALPVRLTVETVVMESCFSKLLELKEGDHLTFIASDMIIRMDDQIVACGDLHMTDHLPAVFLQKIILPMMEEAIHAHT